MKTLILFLGMGVLGFNAIAQNADTISIVKKDSSFNVNQEGNENIQGDKPEVQKNGDTTRIRLGKKGIVIVEKEGKTTVDISNLENDSTKNFTEKYGDHVEHADNDKHDFEFSDKKKKSFDPHFAGFGLGFNNYVDKDFSMSRNASNQFMDLNTTRSWNININFVEHAIPFSTHCGLVTGLGMEINQYFFDGNNSIRKDSLGVITSAPAPDGISYDKSRLTTTFLNVPLLFETQFPLGNSDKPLYFSAGVVGGLKIGSSTKVKYSVDGDKKKHKDKDDYNLNSLRYGFQARIGYRSLHLYATYYPVTLFEDNKGPELYPFNVGIMLANF
jgi:hypothetical protein